jgi:hypothetical protein
MSFTGIQNRIEFFENTEMFFWDKHRNGVGKPGYDSGKCLAKVRKGMREKLALRSSFTGFLRG